MDKIPYDLLEAVDTPFLAVDLEQTKKNISKMQAFSGKCDLRPHIKTHKTALFAHMQIEAGACGITCAKVSEAEKMADSGMDDIFIAYPLIGKLKIKRIIDLAKCIKRLIAAADSLECARGLSDEAQKAGIVIELRLEIDTGVKRTGVLIENAVSLAKEIKKLPGIDLTGIFTYKSMLLEGQPTTDRFAAGNEEGKILDKIKKSMEGQEIYLRDISAGSTPTGKVAADTGLVTEIRPGTYIFNDCTTYMQGACSLDEISAFVTATVISVPDKSYAVIDAGTKAISSDQNIMSPPYNFPAHAMILEDENLRLVKMYEEHGVIHGVNGETGLKIGQKLRLFPLHICTAVNLYNQMYIFDIKNNNVKKENIIARGMVV